MNLAAWIFLLLGVLIVYRGFDALSKGLKPEEPEIKEHPKEEPEIKERPKVEAVKKTHSKNFNLNLHKALLKARRQGHLRCYFHYCYYPTGLTIIDCEQRK